MDIQRGKLIVRCGKSTSRSHTYPKNRGKPHIPHMFLIYIYVYVYIYTIYLWQISGIHMWHSYKFDINMLPVTFWPSTCQHQGPGGPVLSPVLFLREQRTEDNFRKVAQVEGIMNLPESAGHWQPMDPYGIAGDDHWWTSKAETRLGSHGSHDMLPSKMVLYGFNMF